MHHEWLGRGALLSIQVIVDFGKEEKDLAG
jgi:hypothetical protein